MAHDCPGRGRAARPRLQGRGASTCPTTTRSTFGKEFGNRGQCNPTYFTVGNLVKYLIDLRDEQKMPRQGHRRELRVPHGRRLRPLPLRHVRHRVPQGAARRRLRRLPRAAVPADRAASSRRPATSVGLEMNPTFFMALLKAILIAATCSTRSATASAPTRSSPARPTAALEECEEDHLRRRSTNDEHRASALCEVRRELLERGQGRPHHASSRRSSIIGEFWAMTTEGDGNYGCSVPRGGRRRVRHPARHGLAALHASGSSTLRHAAAR